MTKTKTIFLSAALMAAALAPLSSANAWIAVGGYHPYYRPAGCYGCGAAVGAVAGIAVCAAIVDANRPVIVQQPMVIAQPPVYIALPSFWLLGRLATSELGRDSVVSADRQGAFEIAI